eukprot:GHVU01169749.1.p1 GENE.GHVU01169749.1~~GHVU01169749.1.p1  ORF type:complete len:151 (-),score=8.71 GHVU01169749.1:27-479(-)
MDDLTSNSRGLGGTFKAWCYQHGVVSQLIREARENNKDLALIRLNLSNSYIINSMHICTVDTTEVSSSSRESMLHVKYYFDEFRISFSIGNEITNLQRLEIDIASGYTLHNVSHRFVNSYGYAGDFCRNYNQRATDGNWIKVTTNPCLHG